MRISHFLLGLDGQLADRPSPQRLGAFTPAWALPERERLNQADDPLIITYEPPPENPSHATPAARARSYAMIASLVRPSDGFSRKSWRQLSMTISATHSVYFISVPRHGHSGHRYRASVQATRPTGHGPANVDPHADSCKLHRFPHGKEPNTTYGRPAKLVGIAVRRICEI
jgi:hypothetical protein